MKKLFILSLVSLMFASCGPTQNQGQVYVNSQPAQDVYVTPQVANLGDNLDLQALGELVKTSTNAQDLENKLNTPGSINNLDLNGDGQVDYIKVTEYGDNSTKGFSFTVDLGNGQQQEVATIDLQQSPNQQVAMNINGNQQVYGNNAYYSSNYSLGDLMVMHYLFSPHRYYTSPYHYGYYPSYYHSYGMVPRTAYSSRVSTVTKTTRITRTTTPRSNSVKSPNSQLSSSTVSARAKTMSAPVRTNPARSVSAPTSSQKSFSATTPSASRPSTSGFGTRSSSGSSSSSYGSSRSKSSFGSSSRSSSSRSSGRRR